MWWDINVMRINYIVRWKKCCSLIFSYESMFHIWWWTFNRKYIPMFPASTPFHRPYPPPPPAPATTPKSTTANQPTHAVVLLGVHFEMPFSGDNKLLILHVSTCKVTWSRGYKMFSCSSHLSMKFQQLIKLISLKEYTFLAFKLSHVVFIILMYSNVKMPTHLWAW